MATGISPAIAEAMKPGSEERLWKLNKQEPRRGGPTVAVGETHGKGYHKPVRTLAESTNLQNGRPIQGLVSSTSSFPRVCTPRLAGLPLGSPSGTFTQPKMSQEQA